MTFEEWIKQQLADMKGHVCFQELEFVGVDPDGFPAVKFREERASHIAGKKPDQTCGCSVVLEYQAFLIYREQDWKEKKPFGPAFYAARHLGLGLAIQEAVNMMCSSYGMTR